MPRSQTTTTEPHDLHVEWVDDLPATGRDARGEVSAGGRATYYKLRCIALETTVSRLEAELDRTERRKREIISRYEELLQGREGDDGTVFTH
ncbi:MAG: hypothetical protein V5A39_00085 [Haloarculaceae archaeon]